MDTEESQKLLNYQNQTLEDYFEEVRKKKAPVRSAVMLGGRISNWLGGWSVRNITRNVLLSKSPYYNTGK